MKAPMFTLLLWTKLPNVVFVTPFSTKEYSSMPLLDTKYESVPVKVSFGPNVLNANSKLLYFSLLRFGLPYETRSGVSISL